MSTPRTEHDEPDDARALSESKRRLAERDAIIRYLRAAADPETGEHRFSYPVIAKHLHVSVGTAHRVAHDVTPTNPPAPPSPKEA